MKVNEYQVLVDAVEQGVAHGYRRAHKHDDKPDECMIKEIIMDEVLNAICAYFHFENANQDEDGLI